MIQYNSEGKRWYYDDGIWYASVTSFVKNSLPTPPHLVDWYQKNSSQEIADVLNRTSSYGTEFHDNAELFMTSGSLDIDDFEPRMATHLASLAQFAHDAKIRPIETEIKVKHNATIKYPAYFAGTADLVAEVGYRNSRKLSLVDYKTGNITPYHKYQLMAYGLAYAQMNNLEPEELWYFNFRPKDWRKTPTYELKKWEVTSHDWDVLKAMCTIHEFEPPSPARQFGKIELGVEPEFRLIQPEELIGG